MVQFRTFRNTDPPRLVDVWNATFTGRSAVLLPNGTLLERFLFSKPLFDPAGLFIAEDEDDCIGFAHAALAEPPGVPRAGVVCLVGVRPEWRRRGVGTELLRLCETYLRQRDAAPLYAGGRWPFNPFYLGLYGGSESPGFLTSDAAAEPFFLSRGYRVERRAVVLQRGLEQPVRLFDPRFLTLRNRFEIHFAAPRTLGSAWRECVLGAADPVEASVVDRHSGAPVGRTLVWEMDGFSWRWQRPAIGFLDFEVEPPFRRQGLGKFFLLHLLRQLQEQFFIVAEVHLDAANAPALKFLANSGFEQVDTGHAYRKADETAAL